MHEDNHYLMQAKFILKLLDQVLKYLLFYLIEIILVISKFMINLVIMPIKITLLISLIYDNNQISTNRYL